jgi:hypothetical protein
MKSAKLAIVAIASCLSIAASINLTSAASLFVKSGATNAPGPNTCLGFARQAANNQHLQNIQDNNGVVSGAMADKFVVMICVGTVVVISVAADHPQDVKPLADAIFADISRMHKID